MSQIDTRGFAQSYLGGANLGTEQYMALVRMAREQEEARLRREQFAADEMQRETSNNLNERQFGRLLENDIVGQDQWNQEFGLRGDQFDLDLDQFALRQQQLGLDQGQFDFQQRRYNDEQARKQTASKVYATMARSLLQRGAAARAAQMQPTGGGMAGPPTEPGGSVGGTPGMQMGPMAPSPEDEQWSRMIDSMEWSGDAEALAEIMPYLADDRKKAEQLQLMDAITKQGAIPEIIPDDTPQNRATKALLKAFQEAGKPDYFLEAFMRWDKANSAPIITADIAAAYNLPVSMIGSPWTTAANQMATRNQAAARRVPASKVGRIQYNPGGNVRKSLGASVPAPITPGEPLVWDPANPVVQQFIEVAKAGSAARDAGQHDKHSWALDFLPGESEQEYNSRIDQQARQFAASAQWFVQEMEQPAEAQPGQGVPYDPSRQQTAAPAGAPGPSGGAPMQLGEGVTEQDVAARIAELKAAGITDPARIKSELARLGLVR